ncbi:ferric reductase-like transmembrane domain-containing protein [Hoeflea sp. WL0058]|uniref:Ferric reductase-like transmembrane domain-containing protein n=1 Tax=Flavimaribacter sediminis TaxID=2865987 RepID=A0AAE2ZH07_9HYPH|nr:ferric reductase-like transmembrane domain-containing protein [Flavimaribacter sediminis]MBW8636041.1 ferric reductase-like transmembrane domain-containing protein [Flavimaribacter sediminis]
MLTNILNSRLFFWFLLALPGIPMLIGLLGGGALEDGQPVVQALLHPTGEFAARFMIVAMMITPLRMLFPKARWPVWLMRRRRYLGVAAFGYALAHTLLYLVDMGALKLVLDEIGAPGIWTGWIAFAIFIPLAMTSNNAAQRYLLSWWKSLQRWVYAAALLTLAHWILIHDNMAAALVNFAPLALLETYRLWKTLTLRLNPQTAR